MTDNAEKLRKVQELLRELMNDASLKAYKTNFEEIMLTRYIAQDINALSELLRQSIIE